MNKHLRGILGLLLCLTMLTGCTTTSAPLPTMTLPPISAGPEAPIGDAGLHQEMIVPLYLPSHNRQSLLTFYDTLTISRDQHPAEAILRALLSHSGNSRVQPLGGPVTLSLAGANPVEISGGVCTVNLSASALQLTSEDLYTAALAITATLCELPDVNHVNLLVAGTPVAMDVGGNLPLGCLTPQLGQELPVLWEQFSSRRTPVGTLPAATPLTATAALYFPLADGSGIVAEPRRISFPGQHPQQLVIALLEALSNGADVLDGTADMPHIASLMLFAPEVTELESGGRRVTLHFSADALRRITAAGHDSASLFAAINFTLTTFVPSLQQVIVLTGDQALTSLYSDALGSMLFPGAVQTRQQFVHALRGQTALYLPGDGALIRKITALPYRSARSPRALLMRLASPEIAALPADLTDADILGLAIQDGTLLIHLSARSGDVIRASGQDQRLMAYSVVTTLGELLNVRRVRFCFGGEAIENLGSDLCWSGEFLYQPGLIAH